MPRHIEIWYDETSDSDNPEWCVSVCEDDGEEIRCLSTHGRYSDAVAAGKKSAAKRGIELVERSTSGQTSSL